VSSLGSLSGKIAQCQFQSVKNDTVKQAHFFDVDDFTSGAFEFSQLAQEVPESALGDDVIRGENSHFIQRGGCLLSGGQFPANHLEFLQLQ
jgi:hypothetical protein